MKCELLTLCDASSDYNGKLCILGTFDTIFAAQTPTVVPSCSIASRLRFEKGEEGDHSLKLNLVYRDGPRLGGKPSETTDSPAWFLGICERCP